MNLRGPNADVALRGARVRLVTAPVYAHAVLVLSAGL